MAHVASPGRTTAALDDRRRHERNTVLVTGATGYLGRHLIATLLARGYRVNALARTPSQLPRHKRIAPFKYLLQQPPDAAAFAGVRAVVHAAANTSAQGDRDNGMEERAATALCDCARRFGVPRFVYLSSIEARADASSPYGRLKWEIERVVLAKRGTVIRPGLVYGGDAQRGVFHALDAFARCTPAVPAFFPSPRVQPLHVDDLCRALANMIEEEAEPLQGKIYSLAQSSSVTLGCFLRELAWHRHRRLPVPVPIPLAFSTFAAWLWRRIAPGYLSRRLSGLTGLRTSSSEDVVTHGERLGVVPRALAEGLRPSRRRELLEEGAVLLRYVSGSAPSAALARYVRALETHLDGQSLPLPRLCVAFPAALRCIDPRLPANVLPPERKRCLARRLDIAVVLTETHRSSAAAFRFDNQPRLALAMLGVAGSLIVECMAVVAALVVRLVLRLRPRRRDRHAE